MPQVSETPAGARTAAARLAGKIALVTGAASGFGEGIARRFAAEGAGLVLADVNGEGAELVAKDLTSQGLDAVATAADIARVSDLRAAVELAVARHGRLDVMVNNAGIAMAPTPLEDVDDATYRRIADVNMFGVFAGCRAVILNTASTAAVRPRPFLNVYNASKGFVLILTKTLALELAPHGIRVNAINPVMGETGMLKVFTGAEELDNERRRAVVDTIPLGRMSTPADIAAAAAFLASDDAALITGIGLEVDGGRDV